MAKDKIYADPQALVTDFVFDEAVAGVFPDMIQRSVPGYATIINMIATLAARRVQSEGLCYDLGCSLGAAALAMRAGIGDRDCRVIAVDNSPAMLARAREFLEADAGKAPVDFVCADIQDIKVENASMVVLNFTLQFVSPERRSGLLQHIFDGMLPNGILVLSEKIALGKPQAQALFTDMHHAFKKGQGYSDLEISQKRTALENVLLPETLATHQDRLFQAGFNTVEVWFQCFNFVSLLAIK
ncbi:carboxy-S-adenosyl-L-methionine synthase CmoA [endosymbiont of Lamellibrachia barhami]|uniref:carboxy-S-adenosyl-L-methionine synthase CmoA n=1 Tax=endosymbiont of Lamellibrachia barhami TaxID=205975 RepID=UPI00272CF39B|nr:carboxy-S-adenosyl-L-methionine synthase CmoA [endosymbiont of Lamellibrachia barhami]